VTESEIAYAAGFFDGEGSVVRYPQRNHKSFKVHVAIYQSSLPVLEWFVQTFGGIVHLHNYNAGRTKDHWRWNLHGYKALEFLRIIRPYLRVKGEHVDEILQLGLLAPQ